MRFWISWVQPTSDFRPLGFPPNAGILGWWRTGETSDGQAILCAAVEASDPGKASLAIFAEWPEAADEMKKNGWRFFQHGKPHDWRPGDRFPLEGWMKERFERN